MMMQLAETAAAPGADNFSAATLIAILTAIGTLVGAIFHGRNQKAAGVKEQREKDSITLNNNPLAVKLEDHYVTTVVFEDHIKRIEGSITEIKQSADRERGVARTAIGNVHSRLDKVIENQAVSRGELTQINLNVQRLLDRTDGKPPTPSRQG